jgi:ABC-type transporter Mla subunit MlaD
VKVPFVPGPSDVRAAVDGVRDGLGDALELLPRLLGIVGSVEGMVGRVATLLDRAEGVVDRAEGIVDRVEGVVHAAGRTTDAADRAIAAVGTTPQKADDAISAVGRTTDAADRAIAAVGSTQQKADDAISAVGRTTDRADALLGRTDGLVGRVDPLLEAYEQPLASLAPSVRRLADTLDPAEVEAAIRLIDQLPTLVDHLERDILPVLGSLDNVGDDVHDLLDTMQDVRQVVKGFPGSRLFRRRGAEEIDEDEADTGT